MAQVRVIAISLCVTAVCSTSPLTAADDFSSAYQRWRKLESEGEYFRALKEAEAVRSLSAEQYGPDHVHTARVLTELAGLYVDCGKYARATDAGQRALALNEKHYGKESASAAIAKMHLGRADLWMRRFPQGKEKLRQALACLQALDPNHPAICQVTRELCLLSADAGEHEAGVEYGKRAVEIGTVRFGADHQETGIAKSRLGTALYWAGEYQQAEEVLLDAIKTLTATLGDEHPEVGQAIYRLANVCDENGQLSKVELHRKAAQHIFEAKLGPDHLLLGFVYNDFGNLASDREDLVEAEKCYQRSLELKRGCEAEYAMTLGNLAIVYAKRLQREKAEDAFQRSLKTTEKLFGPEHERLASVLMNYGIFLSHTGRREEGFSSVLRCLKIQEVALGPAHPKTITTRGNVASLCRTTGRSAESVKLYEQAIADSLTKLGEQHPITAQLLLSFGISQAENRQYEAALMTLGRSRVQMESIFGQDHKAVGSTLFWESEAYARLGRWTEAMAAADKGYKCYNRFATGVLPGLSENEQLDFLKAYSNVEFVNPLSLAIARPDDQSAINMSAEWALNAKAIRWRVLAQRSEQMWTSGNPEQDRLRKDLVRARERLAGLFMHPPQEKRLEDFAGGIASLTKRIDELSTQLSIAGAKGSDQQRWCSLAEVQSAIPKGRALIEIARQPHTDYGAPPGSQRHWSYGAWLVPATTAGQVCFFNLGAAEEIESAVGTARLELWRSLGKRDEFDEKRSEELARKALSELASRILQPLRHSLSDHATWIVSPDASLWLVPWAALPEEDGYVVEHHAVRFVATGRDLLNRRRDSNAKGAVIVADPDYDFGVRGKSDEPKPFRRLPGTAKEAAEVAPRLEQLFGQPPIVFTGTKATERAVKHIENVSTILLSTHGFFFDLPRESKFNPLLCCGLAFSGANGQSLRAGNEDGILTGIEIGSMNLMGTQLVVLSACDTGVGQIQQGEGVAGLRQAFQLAGANAVMASLWPVPDQETATLVSEFFQQVSAGQDYASALQKAQIELIKSRRASNQAAHPVFWAAFTLTSCSP